MSSPRTIAEGRTMRDHDSSSSRESSPQRGQKRSFSPTSDDEDLVIPAGTATPAPEKPILRQPVAFSWDKSSSAAPLNTYQASLPTKTTTAFFLPGQGAPLTLTPPPDELPDVLKASPELTVPPKKKKAKARPSKKVKHFNDDFANQTGSFRVESGSYQPTVFHPEVVPPLTHGTGPYFSLYRTPLDGKNLEPGTSYFPTQSQPCPTTTVLHLSPRSSALKELPSSRKSRAETKPPTSTRAPSSRIAKQIESRQSYNTSSTHGKRSSTTRKSSIPSYYRPSPPPPTSKPRTNHYRDHSYSYDSQSQRTYAPSRNKSNIASLRTTLGLPSAEEQFAESQSFISSTGYKPRGPRLRLLTLLITDQRTGEELLAEVNVPLVKEDAAASFWAEAEDVCQQLQAGASRIDGPAKVYSFRGRYKQYFLRVTASDKDVCSKSKLQVGEDRTISIFVEELAPLPAPVPPPASERLSLTRSRGLSSAFSESGESMPDASIFTSRSLPSDPIPRALQAQPKKPSRRNSKVRQWEFSSSDEEPPPPQRLTTNVPIPASLREERLERYDDRPPSPPLDASNEDVEECIVNALAHEIKEKDAWMKYIQLKANPTPKVGQVVEQYAYIQDCLQEWVGERAPFDRAVHYVNKDHIYKMLNLEPEYVNDFEETVGLLKYYGPDGSREHEDVLVLLCDSLPPKQGQRSEKRLLRFLREIDTEWKMSN